MFTFEVVAGESVKQVLDGNREEVLRIVRQAYLDHDAGHSVNPDSYFLRFPEKPDSRIIALPAYLGGDVDLAGIKWISSFPANTRSGRPRASAVLILNDYETGYPIACLEAANISSARTAASAALAARTLRPLGHAGTRTAFVGAGVIARNIGDYLVAASCTPDSFVVHDPHEESGRALATHLHRTHGRPATVTADPAEALSADTVIFATTALDPHVRKKFAADQLVLNVSLRDLAPEVILDANNIVDDVEHCLKANTSVHLAEQLSFSRDFITGTLAEALTGRTTPDPAKATVFSPFGLGILDLAVGSFALRRARAEGRVVFVPDFFGETERWSTAGQAPSTE